MITLFTSIARPVVLVPRATGLFLDNPVRNRADFIDVLLTACKAFASSKQLAHQDQYKENTSFHSVPYLEGANIAAYSTGFSTQFVLCVT
ncbi:hypothetical protein [Dyadobacter sp. 22481]|uniref:hypothetical protein n=1 Tax=Dyadobacter sp. 22481 TaxID=3453926 RepID=UPI003F86F542